MTKEMMKTNEAKLKKYENLKTVAEKFVRIYGNEYTVAMKTNDNDKSHRHGIITIEMYAPVLLQSKDALFAMAELHLNSDVCAVAAPYGGERIRYTFSVEDVYA